MHAPLPLGRLFVGAAVFAGALFSAHLAFPPGIGRYGAYLIAFSVWMAWFVQTVADSLRDPR